MFVDDFNVVDLEKGSLLNCYKYLCIGSLFTPSPARGGEIKGLKGVRCQCSGHSTTTS